MAVATQAMAALRRRALAARAMVAGGCALAMVLVIAGALLLPAGGGSNRWAFASATVAMLRGQARNNSLEQDILGARGLLSHSNPYPEFGPASRALYYWPEPSPSLSTHAPTSFLLVLPIAGLDWPRAAQLWLLAQIGCLLAAAWAYGLARRATLLLSPVLLWGPLTTSGGQLTVLWLSGLALAYRWRARPFWAGVCIGVASLAKYLPAVALVYFVRRRAWGALAGCACVWIAALGTVTLLDPSAFASYLGAQHVMTPIELARSDNGALLPAMLRLFGLPGAVTASSLIAAVALGGWRRGSWVCMEWLAVALLPICWTYSLVPLVPGLLRSVASGRPLARTLALGALAAPALGGYPWCSGPAILVTVLLSGLALAVGRREAVMASEGDQLTGRPVLSCSR